jgi:hypothetical protein
MGDFDHSEESTQNELSKAIKGYQDYSIPEQRDKTDQNLRNFLKTKLDFINQLLPEIQKRTQQLFGHNVVDAFKRVDSGVKLLLEPLQNPCYSDQPFFKKANLRPENLTQLYDHDFQLKEQVEILEDEFKQLETIKDESELLEILNHLYDLTDGLNQTLTEREFLFMGD